ncbi:AMP-binding protein [Bosea sp. SSUT16]|jgi:malonyl-CoA/methylmalonyl-CoA synthetase|uniref:AMP-binding protein n=1 Tax=Bosea spartocytisi TaxID=2773451 RepID=A0A927ECW9_9HYPH|nr:AMP-binding protein [Bosea spartocytisi]MBD3848499.1 AMP-binding protein [Bosea spartocytisi]MCT4474922.1 AMP-binding protein [Bosea spartocytisi]
MTEITVPTDANVFGALFGREHDPARVFMETAAGRQLRFGEAADITARYAGLLAGLGVAKGRLVAGLLEKSPEGILLYLAVCRLGAVYLPVHIGLTDAEIGHILRDAEPVAVVCDPSRRDCVGSAGTHRVLTLDAKGAGTLTEGSRGIEGLDELTAVSPSDANAMVYTSGTTGRPKGALLSAGSVIWNARALAACWRIGPDDTLLHANPMAYGLFGTTTPALAGGAAMILLSKFETEAVLAALPRATIFAGVPTYYSRLMADPRFGRELCTEMRLFVTGSAPMRADAFEAFAARTGHRLLDRYGLTEALIATSNRFEDRRRPDTSGLPLPGSRLRIVDKDGQEVPAGTVGMIELQQPFPFLGYWRDDAKTAAAFRDGWFVTGDFGRVDEEGHVSVLGRGADLIITGGLNVYPKEVEAALNALDAVAESAVIGVSHPDFGEAVVAVVQPANRRTPFDPQQAIAALRSSLAGYKVPKRIELVDEMPRNTLGKIQKNLLKQRFAGTFGPGAG